MANWANIARNAKAHGDFAGRTQAEQDAYFEFFAGAEPVKGETIATKVRTFVAVARFMRALRGLRWSQFAVTSSHSTSSK